MLRRGGYCGHEHHGVETAPPAGSHPLVVSHLRSNPGVPPRTPGFSSIGCTHPESDAAASAFKDTRECGDSILHGFGGALVVFSSTIGCLVLDTQQDEFSRRSSRDLGESGATGAVSRQSSSPFSTPSLRNVDVGSNVGSGFKATLPSPHLVQCDGSSSVFSDSLQVRHDGHHLSDCWSVCDGGRGGARVVSRAGNQRASNRQNGFCLDEIGIGRERVLQVDVSQCRVLPLLTGLVGTGVGVSGMGDVERAILLPFGSTPSHRGNHPTRCQTTDPSKSN